MPEENIKDNAAERKDSPSDAQPDSSQRSQEAARSALGLPDDFSAGSSDETQAIPLMQSPDDGKITVITPAPAAGAGDPEPLHGTETRAIPLFHEERRPLKISCFKCQQKLDLTYLEPFARFDCPACGVELIVPKWFDTYLLEEMCGAGGMASVYRAIDPSLDREVAVKILNQDLAGDKKSGALFLNEARTAATLNHYAVAPIFTCGDFEGSPYIVMQYMSGGSLEKLIKSGQKIPVSSVIKWMRDVAEGLDNAQRHGIIHHDVKPGNLMLDSENNAKIVDFGIAQVVGGARGFQKDLFDAARPWISPHYVSPEKALTGQEDHRGDIYSLGASMYHLAAGVTPFKSSSMDELIRMRLETSPEPPERFNPLVPPELSELILSMLDKDPENRPGYREIVKSLNALTLRLETGKAPTLPAPGPETITLKSGGSKSVTDSDRGLATAALGAAAQNQPGKKRRIMIIASAAAAVCVCGAVLLTISMRGGAVPRADSASEEPDITRDYLPKITGLLKNGDCEKAAEAAQKMFEDPEAGRAARAQAALQLAFANYLSMNPHSQNNCAFIAERLLALDFKETDVHTAIVRFLEKPEISALALKLKTEDKKALMPAAALAALLRELQSGAPAEKTAAALFDLKKTINEDPANFWSQMISPRAQKWEAALRGAQDPDIEPLFDRSPQEKTSPAMTASAPSSAPQSRQAGAQPAREGARLNHRPAPKAFQIDQKALDAYLASLPPAERDPEKKCALQTNGLKDRICALTAKAPFPAAQWGKNSPGGARSVVAAADALRSASDDGPEKTLRWEDISREQFIQIMDFYIAERERGIRSGILSEPRHKTALADDLLRLAFYYDWTGDKAAAGKRLKRAEELNPGVRHVRELFFER
jgi:serine/threonine-protein kinase